MRRTSPPKVLAGALAVALACALAVPAAAQERGTVTGKVVDSKTLRPISGAQVLAVGTGIGGLTTGNGQFLLLNVPVGEQTIRVQMVGYGTVEQPVAVRAGASTAVNFELTQTAIALNEVVVTGAGVATEKRKLGNVIASIDVATELAHAPVSTFSELIQGREPGVVGIPGGGLSGEGSQIRIRGSASLTQSNEPIIYVDGVRVDNAGGFAGVYAGGGGSPSRLDDINPESIERIEILKGAAAATLYGTEASNGVIQIFTKKGYTGEAQWNFAYEQGMLEYPDGAYKPNAGFARNADQAARLSKFAGRTVQPFEIVEVPLVTRLFETGTSSTFSGSVNGGNSMVTYYLSGRYQKEDGPMGGEDLGPAADGVNRKQGSLTVNIFPAEKLRVRATTMYSESNMEVPNNNNNIYGTLSLAMFGKPELAFCGTPSAKDDSLIQSGFRCADGSGKMRQGNPTGQAAFMTVRESMQTETHDRAKHFNGSMNLNYALLENVNLDATFGVDFVAQRSSEFAPYGHNLDAFTTLFVDGFRDLGERNHREISFDGKGVWESAFGEDISSQLVVGTQVYHSQTETAGGFGYDFPGPGLEVVSAAATKEAISEYFLSVVNAGVFVQEQIGYRDVAFLTLGARYDANSAFGEDFEGVLYPKASLSVIPSDMARWASPAGISTLRLRAAVGQSGQQPGAFDKFTTYSPLATTAGPGLQPSNLGNQDLEPEVSTEWEAGAELGVLGDRIAFDVTYWNRTVDQALVARQFAVTGGFRATQLDNIGQIKANGWELGVQGMAFQRENVSLDLFASAAYLSEEVTDLGGAPPLKVGDSYPRYRNFIIEGYAPGALFGAALVDVPAGRVPYDTNKDGQPDTESELAAYFAAKGPVDPATLAAGFLMLRDDDGDGDKLDHYLGKPTPDWQGSLGATLTWGNFRLSNLLEFKAGDFTITNLTDAFRKSHPAIGRNIRGAAETEAALVNPASSPDQRVQAAKDWAYKWQALAPFSGLNTMESGNFLRWREVSLTYMVPESFSSRLGARDMDITVTGRNVALFTGYSGIDPELNVYGRGADFSYHQNFGQAIDAFGYPLPRRVAFKVRVGL